MKPNPLFFKLALVLVAGGVCGCALLAQRQARMQAAHELAESRLRTLELERDLQRARARIAERVRPNEIQRLASGAGAMRPFAADDRVEPPEEASQ